MCLKMETIPNSFRLVAWISILLAFTTTQATALHTPNCTEYVCPPLSEIQCPEDSFVREINEETNVITTPDHTQIVEEVFKQCCVTQKCACRTCYIPSCHNSSQVLIELQPETQIPGKCCGTYECGHQPECSEVIDTDYYWLTDCKRCKCTDGETECITVCDEAIAGGGMLPIGAPHSIASPQNNTIEDVIEDRIIAECFSKKLNRFFMSGEKWYEDENCTACECFGEHANCEEICHKTPPAIFNEIHKPKSKCITMQAGVPVEHENGETWEEDNCMHCECVSGLKMCQTCKPVEKLVNCISSYWQRSFNNGDRWFEDNGCSHCMCENGEKQCQMTYCKPTHCAKVVRLSGECCPRCVDDKENVTAPTTTTTTTTVTTTTSTSTEPAQISIISAPAPSAPPSCNCSHKTQPLQPVVIQNAHQLEQAEKEKNTYFWLAVMGWSLFSAAVIFIIYLYRKKSHSSRSYDPVSYTDDNCNKITDLTHIKTLNEK